jgi:hypothetical protein
MGGYRSGRTGGKRCTDDMHRLDVRSLQRAGRLAAGQWFSWQWTREGAVVASINIRTEAWGVTLSYRTRNYGDEWQDKTYPVRLAWTACNYGGNRAWWLCPAAGCGRRVAVLFGGAVYACRHCHQLAYRTQRKPAHDRASAQANKLRKRLGWHPGILNDSGGKPKGMHWATFTRLKEQHDVLVLHSLAGMDDKLGLVMQRLRRVSTPVRARARGTPGRG